MQESMVQSAFDRWLRSVPTPALLGSSVLFSVVIVHANRAVLRCGVFGPWTLAAFHYGILGIVLSLLRTKSCPALKLSTRIGMACIALLANVASNFSQRTSSSNCSSFQRRWPSTINCLGSVMAAEPWGHYFLSCVGFLLRQDPHLKATRKV